MLACSVPFCRGSPSRHCRSAAGAKRQGAVGRRRDGAEVRVHAAGPVTCESAQASTHEHALRLNLGGHEAICQMLVTWARALCVHTACGTWLLRMGQPKTPESKPSQSTSGEKPEATSMAKQLTSQGKIMSAAFPPAPLDKMSEPLKTTLIPRAPEHPLRPYDPKEEDYYSTARRAKCPSWEACNLPKLQRVSYQLSSE